MQRLLRYGLVLLFTSPAGLTFAQNASASLDAARISPTLYFPSAAAELSSRAPLQARVAEKIKQLPNASVAQLADGLDGADDLFVALQRHLAYIKVQALENIDDQTLRAGGDRIAAAQAQLDAAVAQRLRLVPPTEVASLGRYAYLAQQLQGEVSHNLPSATEKYRDAETTPLEASLSDSYDRTIESLGKGGKEIGSPDMATRRAALAARKSAYDQAAPAVAALLGTLVEVENRDAIAQGYANAAERKYESLGLNSTLVEQMVAAVQSQASVYRHYEQVRAEHTAKALGVSTALADEQDIVSAGANEVSFAEARAMILASLRPLGPDYTQRFAVLLDPANGRLDLTGGSHRAETGTSISAYDAPTGLYVEGYKGSLRDVSKIAHEGGHTID